MTVVTAKPIGLYVTERDAQIIKKQVDKCNRLTEIFISLINKVIDDVQNDEHWKEKLKSRMTHLWIIEKMRARCLSIIDQYYFAQIRSIDRHEKQVGKRLFQNERESKREYRKHLHDYEITIGNFLLNSSYFVKEFGIKFTAEELRNIFSVPLKDWKDNEEYLSTKDIKTILFVAKVGDEPLCWAMIHAIFNETKKNKELSEAMFDKVQEIFGPIPTYTAITDQHGNIVDLKPNKPKLKLITNEEVDKQ
ncbi:hypothetical protein [Thermaerobacillus caldiproteolyticus]|uniref:hypothetical protein n=1 Tax=Thermaerobacillus caldiproteolyticus TaxID=247480 RepID=UPI0018F16778|nr:hypothetical protein [Anoxybacillus caldiproteolyticus]